MGQLNNVALNVSSLHMGMVMNISCGIQLLTVFGGKEIERKKKKKSNFKAGFRDRSYVPQEYTFR